MQPFKYAFLVLIASLLMGSCGEPLVKRENGFSVNFKNDKSTLKVNELLSVSISNEKQLAVDSVVYFIDDLRAQRSSNGQAQLTFADGRVGVRKIFARVYSGDRRYGVSANATVLAENPPVAYNYEILESYPHDIKAFTQGIEFKNDTLYESTGQYRESTLRKVNYLTGEVLNTVPLSPNHFGEGLTILDDKIYQLTWRRNLGLVYDLNTMEQTQTFNYFKSKQGWGLCNDGEKLYKSDGTSRIWILDPETLLENDYIEVYTHTSKIDNINELEFIDGKIYANVWQRDAIAIIDPNTGAVEGVINTKNLKEQVTQHKDVDVLNGIAYKGEPGILYLTGKRWDKLFKVLIKKRP